MVSYPEWRDRQVTQAVQKALHDLANALAGMHVTMAEAELALTAFAALKSALSTNPTPNVVPEPNQVAS